MSWWNIATASSYNRCNVGQWSTPPACWNPLVHKIWSNWPIRIGPLDSHDIKSMHHQSRYVFHTFGMSTKLWMQFAFKFCGAFFRWFYLHTKLFVQLWLNGVSSGDTNFPIEKNSADMFNSGSMILQLSTAVKKGWTKQCLNLALSHWCDNYAWNC